MSDIDTSIGPDGRPLHNRILVSKTEPLKGGKESHEEIAQKDPHDVLTAAFFAYIKKMVLFLTDAASKKRGVLSGGGVEHHLTEIKNLLTRLSNEDLSHNQEFIAQLSTAWHALLENLNLVEFLERKKNPHVSGIKKFVASIKAYSSGLQHSLGYYLTEYAGKNWLPFPFIELLQTLHTNHLKNKEKCELCLWVKTVERLLSEMSRK